MNERLLELAKQAGLMKEHGTDREYVGDFDWREFAELIVRECAKAVEYSIWHLPRGYKAVDQAAFVKKYFGVEE